MRVRLLAVLTAAALLAGACGDDDGGEEAIGTTLSSTTSSSTSAPSTTSTSSPASSTSAPTTSTTAGGGGGAACPDDGAVPAAATDIQTAPEAYDGDGDGAADVLHTFRHDGGWWVQAEWAAGGSSAVVIDDAFAGARPLGGFDLDGDGTDEAFVAIAGPASGSLVGVYRELGCRLWPVLDSASGQPFVFPVTASIGAFSGASCNSIGDISLVNGELVDEDEGVYEAGEVPYTYDASTGEVTAGFGDGASVTFDEVGALATLDCGTLGDAL